MNTPPYIIHGTPEQNASCEHAGDLDRAWAEQVPRGSVLLRPYMPKECIVAPDSWNDGNTWVVVISIRPGMRRRQMFRSHVAAERFAAAVEDEMRRLLAVCEAENEVRLMLAVCEAVAQRQAAARRADQN